MKAELKVEGVSEEQIRQDIYDNTRGFRIFFHEPTNADYSFINPFWGYEWTFYDAEYLKKIIIQTTGIPNTHYHRPFIMVFKFDGEDRFAFCSWTCQLYDFNTKEYHKLEGPKLAKKIAKKILDIIAEKILAEFGYYKPEEDEQNV